MKTKRTSLTWSFDATRRDADLERENCITPGASLFKCSLRWNAQSGLS